MPEPTTRRTGDDLPGHLDGLPQPRREPARRLAELFETATGERAALWGSIVGYGTMTVTTPSGRTDEWPRVGFAARSGRFALYGLRGDEHADALLARLGPHRTSKGCVYLKDVDDVDDAVLTELVRRGHARPGDHRGS